MPKGLQAKTVVAPLDRVKILFQASNPDFRKYAGSWSGAFRAVGEIYRNAGVRGLFQGHSATLLRIFPYAGIKFMAYDQMLMPTREQETNARRFLAGAISDTRLTAVLGTMSVLMTYPLDVIRVRMAFQTKAPSHHGHSAHPTFSQAYKQIYSEHSTFSRSPPAVNTRSYLEMLPILKFYRGFAVTLAGIVPYAGVSFLCWGFLRSRFLPPDKTGHRPPTPIADLAIGAISGLIAQTASYPFEIVRRRMQVGGIIRPDRWLRLGETVAAIWNSGGWKGFYVGLSIGYLKVVPMTAVSTLEVSSQFVVPISSDQTINDAAKSDSARKGEEDPPAVEAKLCGVYKTSSIARPTPARPPIDSTHPSSEQTIESLRARIASLEKALAEKTNDKTLIQTKIEPVADPFLPTSPSGSSTMGASTENASPYASPGPDFPPMHSSPSAKLREDDLESLPKALTHLQPMVYNTTSALALLSVGHHGETPRFLYANSTDSTSACRDTNAGVISNSLIARVEDLIRNIPSAAVATALLETFFAECNWRFGIPKEWFLTACSQMWNVLEYPGPHGLQVNANWLSLFFAVLAYAPELAAGEPDPAVQADNSDNYFSCAMKAKRIAEDDYMNKPNISLMVSAADGTVLSCLAVPILCSYLSEHGRVSEAWKLVGNSIRHAEAVGMHRDPEWRRWQVMSKDEVLLRRRAWWGLYIWDKMYSYLLGRPQMLRKEAFDVAVPSIESDGTRNIFCLGQSIFIQLCAIAEEAMENCFNVAFPDFATFFDMDNRFEHWERNLPPEYRLSRHDDAVNDLTSAELTIIDRQRYNLHTWYLLCRMKLHIAALTGVRRLSATRADALGSGKAAILMSTRLIKLQCDTYDSALRYRAENVDPPFPGSIWFFEGCFSLFEATVALISTLTRYSWTNEVSEAEQLVDRAIGVLTQVAALDKSKRREIVHMAAEVLGSLTQESWWRAPIFDTSTASNVLPPSSFHFTGLASTYSMPTHSSVGYDQCFASTTYSNLFGFSGINNQVTSQSTVPLVSV
ncbi:hypothetical protein C0995_014415 [Termitomyces sp. Mi166|nr:hypothetical protein C0995_014415 [Termitomyces sp. Mi166\